MTNPRTWLEDYQDKQTDWAKIKACGVLTNCSNCATLCRTQHDHNHSPSALKCSGELYSESDDWRTTYKTNNSGYFCSLFALNSSNNNEFQIVYVYNVWLANHFWIFKTINLYDDKITSTFSRLAKKKKFEVYRNCKGCQQDKNNTKCLLNIFAKKIAICSFSC